MKYTRQVDGKVWMWHFHHDTLVEPVRPTWRDRGDLLTGLAIRRAIQDRVNYIKQEKDPAEHARRLRLLKPVVGQLPERFVHAVEAASPYSGVRVAWRDVLALHKQECKRCPWNGRTIFAKKRAKKR